MTLSFYMPRGTWYDSVVLPLRSLNKDRKRLRKSPPNRDFRKSFYACKDINAVKSQEALVSEDDSSFYESSIAQEGAKPSPLFLQSCWSSFSDNQVEYLPVFGRMRAKTPVFAIGQLEAKLAEEAAEDTAQFLAQQYQAILPCRFASPFIAPLVIKSTAKGLRKVKPQNSLRDVAKIQSESYYSQDSRTLVSSQSMSSPISLTHNDVINGELNVLKNYRVSNFQDGELSNSISDSEDEAGLCVCMDLLTSELAKLLFRKHPMENEDRASKLQVLLMIETCESVQRQIRQKRHDCQITSKNDDLMQEAEEVLEHWLHVLYCIYDLTEHFDCSDIASV